MYNDDVQQIDEANDANHVYELKDADDVDVDVDVHVECRMWILVL